MLKRKKWSIDQQKSSQNVKGIIINKIRRQAEETVKDFRKVKGSGKNPQDTPEFGKYQNVLPLPNLLQNLAEGDLN